MVFGMHKYVFYIHDVLKVIFQKKILKIQLTGP
jgi:hypothetical protein